MTRKPCVETGCPFLAVDGRTDNRCYRCAVVATDTGNRRKPAQYRDPGYRALRAVWRLSNPPCWICGQLGADTVDHVVPLSRGGTNSLDNLRPAHRKCNSARGVRDVSEEERELSLIHI